MVRKALVVGINRYPSLKDSKGNGQHLTYPAADAEAVARLLRVNGHFEVTLLPETCPDGANQVDEKGTVDKATLQSEISKLFNPDKGGVPDVALLFFAGHGWQESLPRNKVKGYLATSDVDGKRIYGIPFDWLRDELIESPVQNQIVCLDCCHSGEFTNLTFAQADNVNRLFIAACRDSETAHGVKGQGLLTSLLLRGLDPAQNPKGEWITSTSLNNFVHAELRKDSALSTFQQRFRSIPYGEPIQFWQKLGQQTREVESSSVLTPSLQTISIASARNSSLAGGLAIGRITALLTLVFLVSVYGGGWPYILVLIVKLSVLLIAFFSLLFLVYGIYLVLSDPGDGTGKEKGTKVIINTLIPIILGGIIVTLSISATSN